MNLKYILLFAIILGLFWGVIVGLIAWAIWGPVCAANAAAIAFVVIFMAGIFTLGLCTGSA
jgi:hypothetical protein